MTEESNEKYTNIDLKYVAIIRWLRGSVLEDFGSFDYVKLLSLQLKIDHMIYHYLQKL